MEGARLIHKQQLRCHQICLDACSERVFLPSNEEETTIGNGYMKMISLIAAELIERVLVEKIDHLPARFMQLLIALCQEQNTEIMSLVDYARDIQLVAEIELSYSNKKQIGQHWVTLTRHLKQVRNHGMSKQE
jgi:hypothetical protein